MSHKKREKLNKTARKDKRPINKKIYMKTIPDQLPGKPERARLDIEKETTTSAVNKESVSPRFCSICHQRQHPLGVIVCHRDFYTPTICEIVWSTWYPQKYHTY